ncbi:ATP-binding protein [Pseudomonas sp. I3-I5]|uniref:AAA family ATPase n=1 Tax=Pseudomonas sp. I3-I5 TaxID=2926671 RepID=UPI001F61D183|nr:ATP-binding protein [Pseudomonas sp. I3-I5]UNT14928.1 ATP-binding protein [Pseudomonas sp. I3-I5]
MLASESKKDDINQLNIQKIGDTEERVLKSALIFGANASGKSNLIKAIGFMRDIVLSSISNIETSVSRSILPYLLREDNFENPSEIEVVFYSNNIKYRYGLSVKSGEIIEEWLYYTPQSRETKLFERNRMAVDYNKASFSEADLFVKKGTLEKTRSDVPFISVLSGFNGEHATVITDWFKKTHILNGINDSKYSNFTHTQIKNNPDFRSWLLKILKAFQIADLKVIDDAPDERLDQIDTSDDSLRKLVDSFKELQKTRKISKTDLVVVKRVESHEVEFPLALESDGTRKLINILGPIYDSMMTGERLIIDEFDSKFHTLLSKHLFKIFHAESNQGSQIIAAVQDVNLMDTECFRRDQVWFVDKDDEGASELYSLVEYKEKSRTLKGNYSDDYLEGAFGAIPLFNSFESIDQLMGLDHE